ncbi:MAG: polyribonucleotide nucleotidyltransferase [Sedimentisphaerales bacterium]|nr:polyribonucleotide nucleotidyltransferase [Sedimentisphaerales bacterium]
MVKKVERQIAGRMLSIETGKLAKQANGAVVVRYGDTVILATVVRAEPREGIDFFPLSVDYREKTSAAGKFPGGFIKREGRPTNKEILTMRMIDRPIRPLFPKGYRDEVQIQVMVWSADQQNDPDILSMIGSSAALAISDIPFEGPIAAVRIGRVNDEFIINPTHQELDKSSLNLTLSGHRESVNMIEVAAKELSEDIISEAIEFGHKTVIEVCDMISELAADCGKEKKEFTPPDISELMQILEERLDEPFRQARVLPTKQERYEKTTTLFNDFINEMCPEDGEEKYPRELVNMAIADFCEKITRDDLMKCKRADGRGFNDIRTLSGEVGMLPRTHGSGMFTRGETQCLVTVTLGTIADSQRVDGLIEEYTKRFMLHYNFPPFCVGEVRRIMGPSRRDIGHGALAEKSLEQVMPVLEDFPYTVRLVSDILESNGSSSMATVCAGTLALMDAGVPIIRPVAGISIGMVSDEQNNYQLLSDILGEEDHYGDMDFKVAGTQRGITGIQLDLKARGISFERIRETLSRARNARIEILKMILSIIDQPRKSLSAYAPKLLSLTIPVDMIGKIIGPGGREIKRIQEETGSTIEIEDDGTVFISSFDSDGHLKAKQIIELMTRPLQIGTSVDGKVVSIKDFGAFIEYAPGMEGLCHISELSDKYVKSVEDVCSLGDTMKFKVIAIDEQGRIKLSRKAAMKEEASLV